MKKGVHIFLFIIGCILFVNATFTDDPVDPKLIRFGELLFKDKRLSIDSSISCASCHKPEFAFADTMAFSIGVHNQLTARNTPTVMNVKFRPYFFYDGRAANLSQQIHMPVINPAEMNFSLNKAVERLRSDTHLVQMNKELFGKDIDSTTVVAALVAFQESLETEDTEFDKWMRDEPNTLSESAIRGRELFMSAKAKCFDCHFSPDFTGDEFRNVGLYNGKNLNDKGRYDFTKNSDDIGKFKVPGLRNVAKTAPYMHNGMFKTLREVIDFYDNPKLIVPDAIGTDSLLKEPLHLTEMEKKDLENFLLSLTEVKK